jgi:hypothetical protein
MAASVYALELTSILSDIDSVLASAAPNEPATYPEEVEEEAIVVEGLLALSGPGLAETVDLINRARRTLGEFGDHIKRLKGDERNEAESELEAFKTENQYDTKITRIKDRQKALANLDTQLRCRSKRCALKLKTTAGAAAATAPPPRATRIKIEANKNSSLCRRQD